MGGVDFNILCCDPHSLASASAFGIMTVACLRDPWTRVLLFGIVSARQIALWMSVVCTEACLWLTNISESVSHDGHIAGMAGGGLALYWARHLRMPRIL